MDALTGPSIEIDGEKYTLELWSTSQAFAWQQRLLELGLEPVTMMMEDRKVPWAALDQADFPIISRTILDKVNAEGLPKLMKELLAGVIRHDRKPKGVVAVRITDGDYETRYRGKLMHLYKLAGWVIAQNLQDFMTAARWIGEVLRERFSTDSSDESDSEAAVEGEEQDVLAETEMSSSTPATPT